MASKVASTALFLVLNILYFTLVSSCEPPPPPSPPPPPPPPPPSPPPPPPPPPSPPPPPPKCPPSGSGSGSGLGSCPKDVLKFGVCAGVLKNLLHVTLGTPPVTPCCSLIDDMVDLEAAVCFCTALKANILGIDLNVSISLSLLVNYCGKKVPSGFQCS
ncbi:hypothetical protein NE237_003284 [Protea cynaroides]|uniref:Bifunctional inhibitor/plant lipid transfer protein/seed storage helical domain-containing protein n=1 Tax=Protea cynaroides TaxID=273540 RepID=A0A9Q0QSG2_9MAGN|nr:hypothetical protein NE237_003284 [Protea cynaroides]